MRVCVCVCTDQHESGALATGSLLVLIELAMLVCDCLSHCVVALRVIKANDLWGAGPAMIDGHSRAHQGLAEGQQCRRQMPWEGGGESIKKWWGRRRSRNDASPDGPETRNGHRPYSKPEGSRLSSKEGQMLLVACMLLTGPHWVPFYSL